MTLKALKEEYKKSINQRQMDDEDFESLTQEIDDATTLDEFLEVVNLWAMDAIKFGAAMVVLKRILTEI
jgi:hypothetical protein